MHRKNEEHHANGNKTNSKLSGSIQARASYRTLQRRSLLRLTAEQSHQSRTGASNPCVLHIRLAKASGLCLRFTRGVKERQSSRIRYCSKPLVYIHFAHAVHLG